jgi:hypothetical protein
MPLSFLDLLSISQRVRLFPVQDIQLAIAQRIRKNTRVDCGRGLFRN